MPTYTIGRANHAQVSTFDLMLYVLAMAAVLAISFNGVSGGLYALAWFVILVAVVKTGISSAMAKKKQDFRRRLEEIAPILKNVELRRVERF